MINFANTNQWNIIFYALQSRNSSNSCSCSKQEQLFIFTFKFFLGFFHSELFAASLNCFELCLCVDGKFLELLLDVTLHTEMLYACMNIYIYMVNRMTFRNRKIFCLNIYIFFFSYMYVSIFKCICLYYTIKCLQNFTL